KGPTVAPLTCPASLTADIKIQEV
ncbi:unnamed protein product, partial [Didymodactylos carnosus]